LVGGAFGFLQAKDVGLLSGEKFQKIFLQHGTQAVDIPGNQFHARRINHGRPQINTDFETMPSG
jgi:hypothetical protein